MPLRNRSCPRRYCPHCLACLNEAPAITCRPASKASAGFSTSAGTGRGHRSSEDRLTWKLPVQLLRSFAPVSSWSKQYSYFARERVYAKQYDG